MPSIGETNVQLGLNASRFSAGLKQAQGEWSAFSGALNKFADFSKLAQGLDFSRFGKGNDLFEGALMASQVAGQLGGPVGAIGQIFEGLLNTFGTRSPIEEAFGPEKQALIDKVAAATRNAANEAERYSIALKTAGEAGMDVVQLLGKATPRPLTTEESKAAGRMPKNLDWEWVQLNWPAADVDAMAKHWGVETKRQEEARLQEKVNAQKHEEMKLQAREKEARENNIKAIQKEAVAMMDRLREGRAIQQLGIGPNETEANRILKRLNEAGGQGGVGDLFGDAQRADRDLRIRGLVGDGKTRSEKALADAKFLSEQVGLRNVTPQKFKELMDAQISGLSESTREAFRGSTGGLGFNSSAAINAAIDAATRESPARDRNQEQQLRELRDMRRHLEQIRDNTLRNNPPQLKPANF